jgi:hypothetical protein
MSTKGEGWGVSQEVASWSAFGPWELNELNECVHFYFELDRPSERRTAPRGHLNVVLWILHPRKGCSRGVRVRKLSDGRRHRA